MIFLYFGNDEKSFFNDILKSTEKNKNQKNILIVPEQYSFYSEKFVYKNKKTNKYINNLEVFSFKKLCLEIFKKYGYIAGKFATKQTKILALTIAILKLKENFKTKEKKNNQKNYLQSIEKIFKSIEELKKNDITLNILKKNINKIKNNNLKTKTKQFVEILNLYEKLIEKNFKDPTNNINKAIEFSNKHKIFKNIEIYFLFFFRFNLLELKLIETMIQQTNIKFLFAFKKKRPLFKITKNTINKIIKIGKQNNTKIKKQIYKSNLYRNFNLSRNIEKNIFKENKKSINIKQKNNIKIYITKNKQVEIENALSKIIFLNRNGIKWSEIAIMSQNINYYKNELKTAIKNFNIPYFFDENIYDSDMRLIIICKNILEIAVRFDIKIFIKILKSNLTKFTIKEISNFEIKTNIFSKNKIENITEKEIELLNDFEKIEKTIQKLKNYFKKYRNNSKDIAIMLIKTLIVLGIKNKIETEIQDENELENLQKEWNLLIEILENIYILTKNINIGKKEFKTLFNIASKEIKIKNIPKNENSVLISNIQKGPIKDKKAILFLTSNEEFPIKNKYSNEFFTDEEIKIFKNLNLKFLLTSDEKNILEKFITYKVISSPLKHVYFFYTPKEKQNKYNEVINELIEIFNNDIVEKIDEKNYINICTTKKIAFKKFILHYKETTKEILALKKYFEKNTISLKNENKLTKPKISFNKYFNMILSPTQIEQFHLCQFSYFCKYILKIKQVKEKEDKIVLGNITHKILEKIVSLKNFLNLNYKEIENEIKNNLKKIISANFKIKEKKLQYEINKYYMLEENLKKICINIQNELKILGFKPYLFEYEISNFSKIKPLKIKINKNHSILINGIIDRIDIKKIENKKILRIIDYKYNKKNLSFSSLLDGLNLQILLYLIILEKNIEQIKDISIFGVFYLTTIGALTKYETFKKNPKINDIKNFKERLKPTAILIRSEETEKIIDEIKNSRYKEYSPIKTTKENVIYKKDEEKTIISKNELEIFNILIENKIKNMFYNIKNLNFIKNPINLPQSNVLFCEYCEFNEICKEEEILKRQNQKNLTN